MLLENSGTNLTHNVFFICIRGQIIFTNFLHLLLLNFLSDLLYDIERILRCAFCFNTVSIILFMGMLFIYSLVPFVSISIINKKKVKYKTVFSTAHRGHRKASRNRVNWNSSCLSIPWQIWDFIIRQSVHLSLSLLPWSCSL